MKKLGVHLVESKTKLGLASTFMRFQEFYESPVFRGKVFTVDEFAAWYAKKHGSFSYYQDWAGFNIPSWVLQPFIDGKFNPLTEKEASFVDYFNRINGDFYVIGITKEDPEWFDTLKHELVHGAYFYDEDYRKDVLSFISDLRPESAKMGLEKMGYGKNVIDDETNAYLLTEPQTLRDRINLFDGKKIQSGLDRIFQKHFGYSIVGAELPVLLASVNFLNI